MSLLAAVAHNLKRWEIFGAQDIGAKNDPYLDRLRLIRTPLFSVYLHHIHRGETSRHGHDHPWVFWSLILSGWYDEEVWLDKRDSSRVLCYRRKRWSFHKMPLRSAHRVTAVSGTGSLWSLVPCWSLVLCGPETNDWGFYPEGEFVPWRKYEDLEPT